jgi:hypothetical protein
MAVTTRIDNTSIEQLSSLEVFDEKGESVTLSTLWQTQPAVIVFVRHFG